VDGKQANLGHQWGAQVMLDISIGIGILSIDIACVSVSAFVLPTAPARIAVRISL